MLKCFKNMLTNTIVAKIMLNEEKKKKKSHYFIIHRWGGAGLKFCISLLKYQDIHWRSLESKESGLNSLVVFSLQI